MSTTAPEGRLYVVVGLLQDKQGRLFVQQRRAGTPKAGMWEFPGGKLEQGENAQQALARELSEELGINVISCEPLTVVTHDYDHARVWLDTYLVEQFEHIPRGMEGQEIAWIDPLCAEEIAGYDFLPAVFPILDAYNSESRN